MSEEEAAKVRAELEKVKADLAALIDEIDNNYNLSTAKVREKRREVNHLQAQKHALEKQL